MGMNLNTMAFLIREDVTTISVLFSTGSQKAYTFKCTNQLAHSLTEGNEVIVNTCNGRRIATVLEIHEEPQVDPEDDVEYQWAFQRINDAHLSSLHDQENMIEKRLKDRRKYSHRQQALQALGISNPAEFMRELSSHQENHDG